MKRRVLIATIAATLIALATFLAIQNARQRTRIAELEHDNAVASRLCGAVMSVPCDKGETEPQCQTRMGDSYEIIYYPRAEAFIAELRPAVEESPIEEPLRIEHPVPAVQP